VLCSFTLNLCNLLDGQAEASQTYIRAELQKLKQTFRPAHPQVLMGSKSSKFGFDFRPQSLLRRYGSEKEQRVRNQKHALEAQMISLNMLSDTSPIPPLIGVKVRKFGLGFFSLRRCSFQIKQHIKNLKQT